MRVKTHDEGGVRVLEVHGKMVGGSEADAFQEVVRESVADGHLDVVLDLEHVPWIASCGAGMIFRAHSTLTHSDGSLKICNLQDRVNKFFFTIRAEQMLEMFPSRKLALASYSETAQGQA